MFDGSKKKRKRERNGLIEILNGVLSLLVLGLLALGTVIFLGAQQFYGSGPTAADTTFQVQRNSGLGSIADDLESKGIISSRWIFQGGTMALRKERAIKAGEFKIAAGSSMADVLKELTEGTPVVYSVTIPEGFTSWQVVDRLNADESLSGDITAFPAEGTLLPDTYSYERGDDRSVVLARMAKAFDEKLTEVWANRAPDLPVATPLELVTLASIVEKETGVAAERPQVAAVFVNRLKKGMRLQSDPTTIYGITNGTGPLGRGLRQSEIEGKTPFNTYVIEGLPAGPIANPGIDALNAAAHPADSKALYFVADGTGGHAFAASYAEHRKNVAHWREIEKQRSIAAEANAEALRDNLQADEAAAAGETIPTDETTSK